VFICLCGISHRAQIMASSLTASNSKGSLLILSLLILFACLFYDWLYLQKPSVADTFETHAFKLNFYSFKNSIQHAHLYYQIKSAHNCLVDCYKKDGVGLDFNRFGYPISTRFSNTQTLSQTLPQNFDNDSLLTDQDCSQVWQFLMGPLHDSTNNKNARYLAFSNKHEAVCVFKSTRNSHQLITYDTIDGEVKIISLKT